MFSAGADEALDSGILFCSLECSEASRDFLFGLYRPDIPLGLVVAEGHGNVLGEGQHGIGVLDESIQQAECFAPGLPPPFLGICFWQEELFGLGRLLAHIEPFLFFLGDIVDKLGSFFAFFVQAQ